MQKIIIKIYLKNKKLPLVKVNVPDIEEFEHLYNIIEESKSVVKYGQIMFNKSEFRFATLVLK